MTPQPDNGGLCVRRYGAMELVTEPGFRDLVAEYAAEAAIDGMPEADAKLGSYLALESRGSLRVFGATYEGTLIGFLVLLIQAVPHYDRPLAVAESVFVAARHRGTGAGLLLLSQAENLVQAETAYGPVVSARVGSRLADLLERCDYVETYRVFFKKVAP